MYNGIVILLGEGVYQVIAVGKQTVKCSFDGHTYDFFAVLTEVTRFIISLFSC